MTQNEKMSVRFNNIQIASMSGNTGVFTGENAQSDWHVQWKSNCGFGQINGSGNVSANNVNVVIDNDGIDAIASGNKGETQHAPPEQGDVAPSPT